MAGAALLAGCSLFRTEGPQSAADLIDDAPPAWTAVDDTAAVGRPLGDGWLDDFGTPALHGLVEEVWRNNWALLSAIARRDQAAARAQIDKAQLYPRVDAQAQAGRQRQLNDFLGDNPFVAEEAYISRLRVGLGVTWELDLWGRQFNIKEASVGEVWAASLEVEAAKFSLAAQTAMLWFDLIASERQLALREALVENYARAVRAGEERQRTGFSTGPELRQIKSEYAAARADLVAEHLARGRAARALEVLLGRYPANTLEPGTALPELPPPLTGGVPSQLLERRPDVQAAAIRVLASDQRLLAAKKTLLPNFTIQASGFFQSPYRDTLFEDDAFVWSIGGGLLQPLFDGGQIRAGIKAQRAALFEAAYRYRDRVYTAFREVEDGLAADVELRRQRAYVEEALALARDNEAQARESFGQGTLDARIWLATVRARIQAEARLIDLDRLLLNNRVALALALGGPPVAAPAPRKDEPQPVPGMETMAVAEAGGKPVAIADAERSEAMFLAPIGTAAVLSSPAASPPAETEAAGDVPGPPRVAPATKPAQAPAAVQAEAGHAAASAAAPVPAPPAATARAAPAPRAVVQPAAAAPARDIPPPPARNARPAPAPPVAPKIAASALRPVAPPSAAQGSRPLPPKLRDMPVAYRSEFPDLDVAVHVYDSDPRRRFVLIGGDRYRDGDTLKQGPKLVEIAAQGLVLDYRGQRVLYTLGR